MLRTQESVAIEAWHFLSAQYSHNTVCRAATVIIKFFRPHLNRQAGGSFGISTSGGFSSADGVCSSVLPPPKHPPPIARLIITRAIHRKRQGSFTAFPQSRAIEFDSDSKNGKLRSRDEHCSNRQNRTPASEAGVRQISKHTGIEGGTGFHQRESDCCRIAR